MNYKTTYVFKDLALYHQRTVKHVAEELCVAVVNSPTRCSTISSSGKGSPSVTRPEMNALFMMKELDGALRSTKHASSTGLNGVIYPAIAHLGLGAQNRLLEFYNHSWVTGGVPGI